MGVEKDRGTARECFGRGQRGSRGSQGLPRDGHNITSGRGVQPRPAPGIQFVGIPEFTDLGTKVSQEISSAIAGRESVDSALNKSQKLAEAVAKKYEGS